MQLRFPHLGDLHATSGPRNADRLAALDYAIATAAAQPIAAWLWPGDLTHTGMTIEIRNALVDRVLVMAATAPVVIVPGNHDPDGDLDFLARLKTVWPVFVVRTPSVVDVPAPAAFGGVAAREVVTAVACIPYPQKSVLVATGTPHDQLNVVAGNAFTAIFADLGARLDAARRDGRPTLAIGHANVRGSVASTGQPQIGAELEIDESHLHLLGDCPKLFNHIHKHQRVGSALYAGSLCRMDWGETEPKGFVVVTAETDWTRWTYRDEFVAVPVAPMYHVEGTLTRDGFEWEVRKGPDGPRAAAPTGPCKMCADPVVASLLDVAAGTAECGACGGSKITTDWTGCDVRVRVRYPQAERDVLGTAMERVRETFAGARRLVVEPVAIPDRALRAPEVVEAQTLDEKLRAWARLTKTDWTETLAARADALQRTDDGAAIVADVEARLAPLVAVDDAVLL